MENLSMLRKKKNQQLENKNLVKMLLILLHKLDNNKQFLNRGRFNTCHQSHRDGIQEIFRLWKRIFLYNMLKTWILRRNNILNVFGISCETSSYNWQLEDYKQCVFQLCVHPNIKINWKMDEYQWKLKILMMMTQIG